MTKKKTPATKKLNLSRLTEDQKVLVAQQVGLKLAALQTQAEIGEEMGLSQQQISRISKTEACQRMLEELQDGARKQAKASMAQKAPELLKKAYYALEKSLQEGKVEGVKLVFKALGVIDDDKQEQGDTVLHVTMPHSIEKVIDVDKN